MNWKPDRTLQLRMALALCLVAVLPFGSVTILLLLVGIAFPQLGTVSNLLFALGIILVGTAFFLGFLYLIGKRATLQSVGARPTTTENAPGLHAIVGRLAQQADIAPPDIAVVHTDAPNAFTGGWSPKHATVVVTTDLLDTLSRCELEAVLAHELAHVKHRDVAVMSVASLLPTLSLFIVSFSVHLFGAFVDVAKQSLQAGIVGFFLLVMTLPVFLVSGLFWFASLLLAHVLGRYRENSADRGAVRITGESSALASALRR